MYLCCDGPYEVISNDEALSRVNSGEFSDSDYGRYLQLHTRIQHTRETVFNDIIVAAGHYSAFEVLGINDGYGSSAFGERSPQAPNFTSLVIYSGAMAGIQKTGSYDRPRGSAFSGTAELTYRITDAGDRVHIDLDDSRGGLNNLSDTMPVNDDGSFSSVPFPGVDDPDTIKGDFYGPNWEEAAGIFETEIAYGAWLVRRAGQ